MTFLNFTRRVLTENVALKVTALGLSFLMWITVSNDQPVEKVFSVRLEYHNIPDGMEISSQQIWTVDIYIRMPERRSSLSEADFVAFVDLKDATPGEKIIHLDPAKNVVSPSGVEVLKLTPPRITLFLERTIQATVPIEPTLEGTPAEGYEVVNQWVSPTKVYISGPESRVKRVTSARTETVSINNRSTIVKAFVNINVDDPTIRIIDTKPVEVAVDIQEKRREVLIENVPIRIIPEDRSVQLRPEYIKLRVSVPQSFNQAVLPSFFQATANIEDMDFSNGWQKVKPEVEIKTDAPSLVKIVMVLPSTVEVISGGRKQPRTTR